jgi:fructoselysine-6-P-deglycase FrlB-like protein
MMDRRTDPAAALPAAPDPWTGSSMPTRRDGPPFHMTEMIAAEPALAARILSRLADPGSGAARLAGAIRETAAAGRPVLLTGCGTSEHGAIAGAEILREAMRAAGLPATPGEAGAPLAVQAFEASLEATLGGRGGLVIGISHEGGTWATNRALERARESGSRAAIVTVSDRSPGAAVAEIVVATEEQDQSWCHTVGYLSPIAALAAVAGHLTGRGVAPDAAREQLAAGLAAPAVDAAERIAGRLAGVERLIVVGSGADRAAARELMLKVEEGAHLPAAMRDLETFLHGHLAGVDVGTGLVLVLADGTQAPERAARAAGLLVAAAEVGIAPAAILGDPYNRLVEGRLTPAGRIVAPPAPDLPPALAALLSTLVPLQLLTERLARARGVDPDPIRRDNPAYLRAAEAAD